MIRVNLLAEPRAAGAKQRDDIRQQAVVALGLVILTASICLYYSGTLDRKIEALQAGKQEKRKQLAVLQDKLRQVQDYEQRKRLLEDKNRVIDRLEWSQSGPVMVLDLVSQSLEPVRLWLVHLSLKDNAVELEGKALTNDDVVEFVHNLRRTEYFTSVRLAESRAGLDAKTNVFQFKLNMMLKDEHGPPDY
jgi:type IV pilus assembly protein PilN